MKRFAISAVFVAVTLLGALFLMSNTPALADCVGGYDTVTGDPCKSTPPPSQGNSGSQDAKAKCEEANDQSFLNFPTWHRGLECDDSGNIQIDRDKPISETIFTIALNVIDIVLRLAGIIAVGVVIWGGFHYTMSHGEPEKAKKSMNIIRSALIGLVITMIAAVVVNFAVWRMSQ